MSGTGVGRGNVGVTPGTAAIEDGRPALIVCVGVGLVRAGVFHVQCIWNWNGINVWIVCIAGDGAMVTVTAVAGHWRREVSADIGRVTVPAERGNAWGCSIDGATAEAGRSH